MRSQTLILFVPFAFAAKAPRTQHVSSTNQGLSANILATCPAGYEICEYGCMPDGDTCCNDGTSESCGSGYYCIPNSCCPKGEECNIVNDDNACDTNEALCGDYCIPITGTCCNSQGYYCPDFGICTSNGLCCDLGGDCESSGSSSDITSTFESPSTSSLLSSGNSKDGATFVPSKSTLTEKGDSLPTPAFTTEDGDNGLTFPTGIITGDNDSSPQSTQPHITVTITPSSTPARSGQAGVTDCRIIACLAGITALFTQYL
ncbi:hypothetical protein GGR58DRAFT_465937 [Xylaria digitata]|nr:hypothetical protein GGR58DRAFT_465937 [Xylaria digitata]